MLFHSGFFFRRKANETKRRKLGPNLCSTEQGQSVFNGVASIIPPVLHFLKLKMFIAHKWTWISLLICLQDRLGLNPHGPSLSPSKVLTSSKFFYWTVPNFFIFFCHSFLISFLVDHGSEHNFSIVGEEVHVKKGNRLVPAIVRYCRTGGEFKVQFADGHFEWIGEDHLQFNGNFFLLIFQLFYLF